MVNLMSRDEHRKHLRVDAVHLLNYVCMDQGNAATQGMGRTLNVSEAGILLETHAPLEDGATAVITLGIEDDLIQINGKVIYVKETAPGIFTAGIEFFEIGEKALETLRFYIRVFSQTNGKVATE